MDADVVLTNGAGALLTDDHPEAGAVAIINDRIAAVGESARIADSTGPETELIDLDVEYTIVGDEMKYDSERGVLD